MTFLRKQPLQLSSSRSPLSGDRGGRAAEMRRAAAGCHPGSRLTPALSLPFASPLTVSRSDREERKSPRPPRRGLGKGGVAPCVVTVCEHERANYGCGVPGSRGIARVTPATMMAAGEAHTWVTGPARHSTGRAIPPRKAAH